MLDILRRSISVFLVLLLMLSSIMTGTFCWQTAQLATNIVIGSVDDPYDPPGPGPFPNSKTVELVKLEKKADGTLTEKPIAGTEFLLFKENGTQVGVRYITDENGKITVKLQNGNYYFEETAPGIGYTYDIQSGQTVTKYPFNVSGSASNIITVKAYNIRLEGSLLIRKIVENADGSELSETQKKTPFEFTVTFGDNGTYTYHIDNQLEEKYELTSGETLKLTHGQTAVFENIPAGVLYHVTETPLSGYIISGSGHRGNVVEEAAVAEFINRTTEGAKAHSLTVTKEVTGNGADRNKEFTFSADIGGAIETFTLKHGESKTFTGIVPGTEYLVREELTNDKYTAAVKEYKGRVIGDEAITLPFINSYEPSANGKKGSLTISKTVNGEDADATKEFEFTAIIGNKTERFTLKHNENKTFNNIPHGTAYLIEESDASGYWPVIDNTSGVIAGNTEAKVSFVNTVPDVETGSIIITKQLTGDKADTSREFKFTAVIGGVTREFSLKHGESKTFAGLPIGTKYAVYEQTTEEKEYISTVKEYSGRITDADALILPFVNVYDENPDDKSGSLSVTKKVSGKDIDKEKLFGFEVVFEGENAPENQSFTLKADEIKLFENIPYGISYTVRETNAAGYNKSVDAVSGIIAGDITASIAFRNTKPDDDAPKTKITVTKKLSGEYSESEKNTDFEFVLDVNDEKTEFTLKPDETKEFYAPLGAAYEVSEKDYFTHGYVQNIINGAGTANGDLIEVIVTNSHHSSYTEKLYISGEKTWNMGTHTHISLPEEIIVRLKNGNIFIEEQIVKPGDDGKWKYSFTVPRYHNGSLAVYTLEEASIDGYAPTYSAYNIVNTYVEPIFVDPPLIRKVVSGEGAPTEEFSFVFKGTDGLPMPEGSDGNIKKLKLTGAGELEIGKITFTRPGVYTYSVNELSGGAEGWIYDDSEYTISFNVTEQNGKLVTDRTIRKNGEAADEIVFTNTFDKTKLSKNIVISGTKTWNHGANAESKRPTSITVKLLADGKVVEQKQVTAKNSWKYSFSVPRFAEDGHEIVYSIDEADVQYYQKSVNGYNLHNKYTGKKQSNPQTGDNNNLIIWFTLMILSAAGLVIAIIFERKQKKQ